MKTLVFGASLKTSRYSNLAIRRLRAYHHEVEAIGLRIGKVLDVDIKTGHPTLEGIDTITMYIGAPRQEAHIDYLLSLNPRRIVFNPGAENPILTKKAREMGIQTLNACTLVMLSTGEY